MRGGAAGAAARDDRRLMKWYVADRMRFGPAMSEGVEAKHAILTGAVVAELKEGSGPAYQWAARALTQYKVTEALPVLAARLGDADARVREWTALALCREWSEETVTADDGKRGGARERVSDRAAGPKRGLLDGGERLRRGGVFCKMGVWENYSFAISCGIDTCRWT